MRDNICRVAVRRADAGALRHRRAGAAEDMRARVCVVRDSVPGNRRTQFKIMASNKRM